MQVNCGPGKRHRIYMLRFWPYDPKMVLKTEGWEYSHEGRGIHEMGFPASHVSGSGRIDDLLVSLSIP